MLTPVSGKKANSISIADLPFPSEPQHPEHEKQRDRHSARQQQRTRATQPV